MTSASPIWIWGVPFLPVTFIETLDRIDELIAEGKSDFIITANLHYTMLTANDARLPVVNQKAAFIVADGMPLVWASRWRSQRLPERVAGADLVPALCERAAQKGHRIFFLGGAPGVGEEAAQRMIERYPGLQIVGVEVPPFRDLTEEEHRQLLERIREKSPHILFVAFGQPKGEIWLAENCERLGVPVCMQIGGTFDFLAGRVKRAPRWLQRLGLEWAYRMYREPMRLTSRYACNGLFVLKMLAKDLYCLLLRRGQ